MPKIVYYMDGERFLCFKHYKRNFLQLGRHLSQYKSDRPGLCWMCAADHVPLIPFPKQFIPRATKLWLTRITKILSPYLLATEFSSRTYEQKIFPDGNAMIIAKVGLPQEAIDSIKRLSNKAEFQASRRGWVIVRSPLK